MCYLEREIKYYIFILNKYLATMDMKTDIRALAKELVNITNQLVDFKNMTEIQSKERFRLISEQLKSREIFIDKCVTYGQQMNFEFSFTIKNLHVAETGIIKDVRAKGSFPFVINVDNILVYYEPRDLQYMSSDSIEMISNYEFVNFKKGDEYKFQGKILSFNIKCDSLRHGFNEADEITFKIEAESDSEVKKKYEEDTLEKVQKILSRRRELNWSYSSIGAVIGLMIGVFLYFAFFSSSYADGGLQLGMFLKLILISGLICGFIGLLIAQESDSRNIM